MPENSPLSSQTLLARLPIHPGQATLLAGDEAIAGPAEFLLPADQSPLIAIRSDQRLSNNFASQLRIVGESEWGSFEATCGNCYTNRPMTGAFEGWSFVRPLNGPLTIDYRPLRPPTAVRFLLNNFDYEMGDAISDAHGWSRVGTPFSVSLGDRNLMLRRREDYADVQPLLRAECLRLGTLVEAICEVRAPESDNDLLDMGTSVAGLLTLAHGTLIGVGMIECLDDGEKVVRRIVPQPIRSQWRDQEIVPDPLLPQLFQECFSEYRSICQSALPWNKLVSHLGCLEDPPFIEQKLASLMTASEFFMRTSLLESGLARDIADDLHLQQLIGRCNSRLRWNIPKHYNAKDGARHLRNAVSHGLDLPMKDKDELRRFFGKWRLFLFRRALIRVGYTGRVVSPDRGWWSESVVGDFSEEHNSFDTSQADSHPFAELSKRLRQRRRQSEPTPLPSGSHPNGEVQVTCPGNFGPSEA